jgi:LysR family glycine cleavage system transcriptional activator
MTCLHDANWVDDWSLWIASAMQGEIFDTSGPVFSLYSLAVEEAQNGAGVLIGHEPLIREHLASGALVAPFETQVTLDRTLSITVAKPESESAELGEVIKALSVGATVRRIRAS